MSKISFTSLLIIKIIYNNNNNNNNNNYYYYNSSYYYNDDDDDGGGMRIVTRNIVVNRLQTLYKASKAKQQSVILDLSHFTLTPATPYSTLDIRPNYDLDRRRKEQCYIVFRHVLVWSSVFSIWCQRN